MAITCNLIISTSAYVFSLQCNFFSVNQDKERADFFPINQDKEKYEGGWGRQRVLRVGGALSITGHCKICNLFINYCTSYLTLTIWHFSLLNIPHYIQMLLIAIPFQSNILTIEIKIPILIVAKIKFTELLCWKMFKLKIEKPWQFSQNRRPPWTVIKIYKSSSDQIFPDSEDFYWSAVMPRMTIIYFTRTT